jgi:uracil-DNA glycosylase family protein
MALAAIGTFNPEPQFFTSYSSLEKDPGCGWLKKTEIERDMKQLLVQESSKLVQRDGADTTAAPLIPARPNLKNLKAAARNCQACPLWKTGTQTVFGDGAPGAKVIFVGEQPGNDEDLAGQPFVGPAGALLDKALVEAGIDRSQVYVTNTVKHFKWEPKGKRRIHKKPSAREIAACRPWLNAELEVLKPKVLVCLGATASQALLGRDFKVSQQRGKPVQSNLAPNVIATVHPSSILRAPDPETRHAEMRAFVADLKKAAKMISKLPG